MLFWLGQASPAFAQTDEIPLFAVVDINTKVIGIEAAAGTGLTSASDQCVLKLMLSRDLRFGIRIPSI